MTTAYEELYKRFCLTHTFFNKMKVCRLCLQKLQRGSKYFNINAVESFTGFMPYRDQLTTCIPEMALDLIPNPVICKNCRLALKSAYDFKSKCLFVEKKIREYIENQPDSVINYDLSQISLGEVPVSSDNEQEEESTSTANTSSDSNMSLLLKQLQQDDNSHSKSTVLVTSVPKRNGKFSRINHRLKHDIEGNFTCTKCGNKFADAQKLSLHKVVHGDDFNSKFICNFCGDTFRSLQNLRRHNSNCSKATNKTAEHTILTKRPHLPTKAKNYLKRWLFCHTDHPYPTDLEKQMLMQETNLTLLQVENWFINARRRILQDLTKLKHHGVTCDEAIDNTLGLQIDIEDIMVSQSSPEIRLVRKRESISQCDDMEDIEEAIPPSAIIKIKPDPDLQDEPLDISHIKTESIDDR